MTQQELQQAYNRQNWQTWLSEIFGSQVQFEAQAENIDIGWDNIKSAHRFASVKLADGKNLALLDIEIIAGVRIARNRVGLRKLVVKFIDHARYHGILAFYHNSPSPVGEREGGEVYRLSFISSEPKIDTKTGAFSVEQTAPKRFSYVLGENAKTKTPADRLKTIANKRGNATLEDIKTAFSVETLTKEFYAELSNWYFWALQYVRFPQRDNEVAVIRLITRLMFVWFIKQKHLVPNEIFEKEILDKLLNYKDKTNSTYYKAILQNLFFATLNTEMGNKRKFVNRQSGIQGFFRYERFFTDKESFVALMKNIPFLNGGLFENLDKNVGEKNEIRIDCFSNRIDKEELLKVPDFLFFSNEQQVDLNKIYDTKGKTYKVRGLIDILKTYNFTIEENTPTDIEVALDPELLGKVFENLLASFNPETQITARKQTGSFYTPREIVDYMVNESLKAHCRQSFDFHKIIQDKQDFIIDYLFDKDKNENINLDNQKNLVEIVIQTINDLKILDPACGSGAFPMGVLQKMVQILQKLDPDNKLWKQRQLALAEKIEDEKAREAAVTNIEEAFENNELDYGRKLFLIENSIFCVDIQPIAVQIAKLRFFISLICEQTPNPEKPNLGIRPLPNLETKFVAAHSLIGLEKPKQLTLGMNEIEPLEKELAEVRHKHFSARTPETKRKYREKDGELRTQIAQKLKEIGFNNNTAEKIASWNPYDQNTYAEWFDTEWMFGITDGFDIVIGNPPYVVVKKADFPNYNWNNNLYTMFYELSLNKLLKNNGTMTFITPRFFLFNKDNFEMRKFFLEKINILSMVECKPFDAITENEIAILKKENPNKAIILFYSFFEDNRFEKLNDYTKEWAKSNKFLEINPYLTKSVYDVLKKIDTNVVLLSEISDNKRGAEIGKNDLKNTNEGKPILIGGDVQKYAIELTNAKIDVNHKEYKRLNNYFENDNLILLRRVSKNLVATISENPIAYSKNLYGLKIKKLDTKFVLGLLNSKLLNFYYKKKFSTKKEDVFPEIQTYFVEQLPIPNATSKQQQPLIALVNYMLFLKNRENANLIDMVSNEIISNTIEKVIDACVYELYFEDEIKASNTNILSLLQAALSEISQLPVEQQIKQLYTELNDYKNEIRNRIILQETRSESVSTIIKSTEI